MIRADIVTVFHNETNHRQHQDMFAAVRQHEPAGGYRLIGVDNRTTNRGFGAACNLGAFHPQATASIIGFLNPDVKVTGPFLTRVEEVLTGPVVITGCRFNKPDHEVRAWGLSDWVCGATFFVRRDWFQRVGGFDPRFTWAFEETDLIRQALGQGLTCASIRLPLHHASPTEDNPEDAAYKRKHFAESAYRYGAKWGRR